MTDSEEEAFLDSIENCMIVNTVDGNLACNCQISRHSKRKNRHRADVMIALQKEFLMVKTL